MRESYQENDYNQIKNQFSHDNSSNIIKITPFGYDTLTNAHEWITSKN